MKKIKSIAVDIETLGTPERSGYDQVIPNLALVWVPEDIDQELQYIYTRLPVQEQFNAGLTVDAEGMAFWMGMSTFEDGAHAASQTEVLKALKSKEHQLFAKCLPDLALEVRKNGNRLTLGLMKSIFRPEPYGADEVHFYGKGCHFDYSILQANMLKMHGSGDFCSYRSPQNVRTLETLFNEQELSQARLDIEIPLQRFIDSTEAANTDIGKLVLHHPLYDAAREALLIAWMLKRKRS